MLFLLGGIQVLILSLVKSHSHFSIDVLFCYMQVMHFAAPFPYLLICYIQVIVYNFATVLKLG